MSWVLGACKAARIWWARSWMGPLRIRSMATLGTPIKLTAWPLAGMSTMTWS